MAVSFSQVTAAWNRNPPNYTAGETITGTISGSATQTSDTVETWGPVQVPVTANGEQSTVTMGQFQVTKPGTLTAVNVTIDQSRPITGVGTRTVTYSADGKSFSVVA